MMCKVRGQVGGENVKTFFDSEMPGIKIQVNATAEALPAEYLTVWLRLAPQTSVYVELLRFEVYGFLNGTDEVSIGSVTDYNFSLSGADREYNGTFFIPGGVWGVTFGQIKLTYSASLGGLELRFPDAVSGFYMTHVENTLLKDLENQLKTVNDNYTKLNDDYTKLNDDYAKLNDNYTSLAGEYLQLNQTFVQLQQNYTTLWGNYTALQGSMNDDLDNTRRVAVILAVTTVFFVATTVFMVMRRPKESW
jgi:hypothetical protein